MRFVSKEKSLRAALGLSVPPSYRSPHGSFVDLQHFSASASPATAASTSLRPFPSVVGHRGCLYQELENTRKGFVDCATMGCQAVELDVFMLQCGTLVVFHGGGDDDSPGDLIDYCGVKGSILDVKDYSEALTLKFNPDFEEFPCPQESVTNGYIPTLEQVLLDAQRTGVHVKIELKGEGTVQPTIEMVERLGMTDQCSYACFDLEKLQVMREFRPDVSKYRTGALFDDVPDDYLEQARACGATEVHLRYDTCTKARVDEIHAAGFGSMLWMRGPVGMASDCKDKFLDTGNEDISMYRTLMETGVQQMCINRPDVLLSWMTASVEARQ